MYQEYIGKTLTFEESYFIFKGYNYAMIDVEDNENGTPYKGKVVCVSNDPLEIRAAFKMYDNRSTALLQGEMDVLVIDSFDVPVPHRERW